MKQEAAERKSMRFSKNNEQNLTAIDVEGIAIYNVNTIVTIVAKTFPQNLSFQYQMIEKILEDTLKYIDNNKASLISDREIREEIQNIIEIPSKLKNRKIKLSQQALREYLEKEIDSYQKKATEYKKLTPCQREEFIRKNTELDKTQKSPAELLAEQIQLRESRMKDNVKNYLLVEEDIISPEEAEKFNYKELSLYQECYIQDPESVKKFFEAARRHDSKDKNYWLNEITAIPYNKIPALINLKSRDKMDSLCDIKQYSQYNLHSLGKLRDNYQLLKIFKPEDILNLLETELSSDKNLINRVRDRCLTQIKESPNKLGEFLKWAAEKGHIDVVKWLITEVNFYITHIIYVFVQASAIGHYDIVKFLFTETGDILSNANAKGRALLESAREGHKDIIQFLLDNAQEEISIRFKEEALKEATGNNRHDIIEVLSPFLKNHPQTISNEGMEKEALNAEIPGQQNIIEGRHRNRYLDRLQRTMEEPGPSRI